MITTVTSPSHLRMLLPETLWLEPEHFATAQRQSDLVADASEQWQAYIQMLAQLSLRDWLRDRLPTCRLSSVESPIAAGPIGYFSADNFRLCVVATEHVLDEIVRIPCAAVDLAEQCAHYYVLVEVLEDRQEAVVRGFLRYDELTAYLSQTNSVQNNSVSEAMASHYRVPLSFLDSEPDHLVAYIQQLSPEAIVLPAVSTEPSVDATAPARRLSELTTCVGQWLEGNLTKGWQTVDRLVNPEDDLVLCDSQQYC